MSSISLVTPVSQRDLELCALQCESVDRYLSCYVKHHLIVPDDEVPLFDRFNAARRVVVPASQLLPAWLRPMPRPLDQQACVKFPPHLRLTLLPSCHIVPSLDRERPANAGAEGALPRNSQAKGPDKGPQGLKLWRAARHGAGPTEGACGNTFPLSLRYQGQRGRRIHVYVY